MMVNASIADRAVAAIAAVTSMDADVANEHDERHTVRSLKRIAETVLIEAFLRAQDLAYLAQNVREDGEKARAAAKGSA